MVYVIATPMIEGKINAKDKRIHFADVSRFVNALWSKITTSVSIAETIAPIILERLVYDTSKLLTKNYLIRAFDSGTLFLKKYLTLSKNMEIFI